MATRNRRCARTLATSLPVREFAVGPLYLPADLYVPAWLAILPSRTSEQAGMAIEA